MGKGAKGSYWKNTYNNKKIKLLTVNGQKVQQKAIV